MKLDLTPLYPRMLEAAKAVAGKRWPALEAFAEMQFAKLSTALAEIQRLHAKGTIDARRAHDMAMAEQRSIRTTLAAIQGLGILTAEKATEAATRAIPADVNKAVGFKLL